jgi:hypothetical protein
MDSHQSKRWHSTEKKNAVDKVLEKFIVHSDSAQQIAGWLKAGRGVAHWTSIDLSDPGFELTTPALQADLFTKTEKPHWKVGSEPKRVIFDASEVEVRTFELAKRFHVGVRMGGNGLALKVTDGGTRRINRELAKTGDGATYSFDHETQDALIFRTKGSQPLTDWLAER